MICPYWVNWMLTQMKKRFENTPSQQEKIYRDKKLGCQRRISRRKARFNSMLNHMCGIPKGDARGPPPTKQNTCPNKGGEKMAKFVLATGRYDRDSLETYLKCLEDGATRRQLEDAWGRLSGKRKKGDCQSYGTDNVAYAQKRRLEQKKATNEFYKYKIPGWQTGARGTESRHSSDGTLLPLSHFQGRCTGECHGDHICGRREKLKMCELCFRLEGQERWLCSRVPPHGCLGLPQLSSQAARGGRPPTPCRQATLRPKGVRKANIEDVSLLQGVHDGGGLRGR